MNSIKSKLRLWLMIGVTVVVAITGLMTYQQNRSQDEEDYQAQRASLQARLALALPHGVWQMDDAYTRLTLDAELGWSSVLAIRITGDAGLNIGRIRNNDTSSLRDMAPAEKPVGDDTLTIPIIYQNREKLGVATIYLSRSQLAHRQTMHLLEILLEILILDGLIFIVMTYNLNRFVFDPLKELQRALDQAASSNDAKSLRLTEATQDEFGAVRHSFNRIVDRISADLAMRTTAEAQARQERDNAEHALQQLVQTQQTLVESEKLASLGSLVAGVAHEINTPVGITLTTASHLATTTLHITEKLDNGGIKKSDFQAYLDSARECCDLILSNSERAASLIHSFKQVAVDQTSEQRRDFQLNDYLSEIVTSLRPRFKRSQTNITIDCEDDLLLDSYPGAISQVVTNLLVNALVHGFEEKPGGNIHIRAERYQAAEVRLSIQDDGKGIPVENINRVFDPFFTTRRGNGGSGLGLHIVYNIIRQRLGGTIEVHSEVGKGSIFTITMPCTAPEVSHKEGKR
ncbi:HAMP domain-containing sensor histidine kinase [Aquitalea sp. LB_tupeE]|uniref:sensor histidine kinase n=1 Tax=Aquitalea sp. LB_tupeE TaxID=2748078 RepID=UPI0015BB3A03|nr:HAMP domain-containing sensor histidine kinase [Aquitalea sp. LB_tupeE]NWK77005.1 HAMP domain-containing histidine kinase [Aquitalea sp. LB_tupeE]